MKKLTALLLVFAMVFSLTTTALADSVAQDASETVVQAGEEVTVTLTLEEPMEQIRSFDYRVYVDKAVFTWTSSKIGSTYQKITTDTDPQEDGNGFFYGVYLKNTTAVSQTIPAGTVCTMTFTANSDLTVEKVTSFWMRCVDLTDASGQSLVESDPMKLTVSYPGSGEVELTPVTTAYTVSASENQEITVGETAAVKVMVASSANETYNAYDLTLTYDTDGLTYVSGTAADNVASVTEQNGTIRVVGCGTDKSCDTAAVTLQFTGKATGDANVTITGAKVDVNENSDLRDAPDAAIADAAAVITVTAYKVTLGTGLIGEPTAQPGVDYTFRVSDPSNYDYDITVKVKDKEVSYTNNGDGSYTIPAANITGNIEITAVITPKNYTVTVDGTGKSDVTAAGTATYGTDYTFTVKEADDYTYTVSVKIDGQAYALGIPDGNGTYTIPGTDIAGDITIIVDKEKKPPETVNVTKPDWVIGDSTANKGEDYTFSIQNEAGYTYGTPTVKVDGTDITSHIVKNSDGSYTIPGAYVTGAITIEVTRADAITVDVTQYLTLNQTSMWLITVKDVIDGKVAQYDGMNMYWSESYGAHAYLVISNASLETVNAEVENKISVVPGEAGGTVDYTGDVNDTGRIDINDAQLTYDMYNAVYSNFEKVSMLKFLNADVNGSKNINVQDATTVVNQIVNS